MAYVAAVTLPMGKSVPSGGVPGIRILIGQVDITSYHATLAEITGITQQFRSLLGVVAGATETGAVLRWNHTSKAFQAFVGGADGGMEEAANDADLGVADFIAIGI